jgi:predicted lysophospholipase L1 biosynthesis ABC-type transport system permease subunit
MSFFPRLFAKRKADFGEEIQAHLQMDIQNRKDRGESPEEARRAAMREFGNVPLIPQITPDTLAYQSVEGLNMALAVRTDRSPSSMIPELRELMRQASPELSDSTFTTMDQVVEDSYGSQQLAARLLIVFGGSALLVCITGIYGLLAYLVAHRTKELGLRIALGAQRSDVMWLVLRQASWMLVAGSTLGLILAYMTSLLLRTFLYNITAHDPWTMGAVTALLVCGGLAASCIPARRAAMVNPIEALRTE